MRLAVLGMAVLAAALVSRAGEVDLARTTLATVAASSVAGVALPDDPNVGLPCAFDGTVQTVWCSDDEAAPWIEVRFAAPVSVRSVVLRHGVAINHLTRPYPPGHHLEGQSYTDAEARFADAAGTEFAVELFGADGTPLGRQSRAVNALRLEYTYKRGEVSNNRRELERIVCPIAAEGVARVRITFAHGDVSVGEVAVLGEAPAGVVVQTAAPSIAFSFSERRATRLAAEAMRGWHAAVLARMSTIIDDQPETYVITYRLDDVPVLRFTFSKKDGVIERSEMLAKLVAVP